MLNLTLMEPKLRQYFCNNLRDCLLHVVKVWQNYGSILVSTSLLETPIPRRHKKYNICYVLRFQARYDLRAVVANINAM